jgi:hypothetical protein
MNTSSLELLTAEVADALESATPEDVTGLTSVVSISTSL